MTLHQNINFWLLAPTPRELRSRQRPKLSPIVRFPSMLPISPAMRVNMRTNWKQLMLLKNCLVSHLYLIIFPFCFNYSPTCQIIFKGHWKAVMFEIGVGNSCYLVLMRSSSMVLKSSPTPSRPLQMNMPSNYAFQKKVLHVLYCTSNARVK